MWIETAPTHPSPGGLVEVSLRLGHGGDAEPVPRRSERIVRFDVSGPDGSVSVPGVAGQDPAGYLRLASGSQVIVYQSDFAFSELPGPRFSSYLEESGLVAVAEARRRAGTAGRPGRERYARALKRLVTVGSAPPRDRVQGLPYELVLEAPTPGDGDQAGIAFVNGVGRPVPGVRIVARPLPDREGGTAVLSAPDSGRQVVESDAEGRAVLSLTPGSWLVSAVHAEAAPPGAVARDGEPVDWETWFVSVTFEWPSRADRNAAAP